MQATRSTGAHLEVGALGQALAELVVAEGRDADVPGEVDVEQAGAHGGILQRGAQHGARLVGEEVVFEGERGEDALGPRALDGLQQLREVLRLQALAVQRDELRVAALRLRLRLVEPARQYGPVQ